jgi:hypothetical protein
MGIFLTVFSLFYVSIGIVLSLGYTDVCVGGAEGWGQCGKKNLLHCPQKLWIHIETNADPEPALYHNADPDPGFREPNQCGSMRVLVSCKTFPSQKVGRVFTLTYILCR